MESNSWFRKSVSGKNYRYMRVWHVSPVLDLTVTVQWALSSFCDWVSFLVTSHYWSTIFVMLIDLNRYLSACPWTHWHFSNEQISCRCNYGDSLSLSVELVSVLLTFVPEDRFFWYFNTINVPWHKIQVIFYIGGSGP